MIFVIFTCPFMMNIKANFESCNNGIGQYSFYKDNVLNTTFGNVAHRKNSSIFAFINWAATKSTRIYMNSGVSYVDLSNKNLDLKNHGWQGNMIIFRNEKCGSLVYPVTGRFSWILLPLSFSAKRAKRTGNPENSTSSLLFLLPTSIS